MEKGKQFGYLCSYKSNFDHLKNEIKKLWKKRESVQHRVDVAKDNGEEIEQSVDNWLISVDKIVNEAVELVGDEAVANKQCFKGLCPNLRILYQLSKKAVREVKAVVQLQHEGMFERVSFCSIPRDIYVTCGEGYSERYQFTESRKDILNDILDALRGPYANMIGVYGMGGVGKTTLVKEVSRQAKQDRIFDEVVFAVVSQIPDVKRIQGEIANQLGLIFCEESESERTMMLCDRLKKKRKILVILDDIWTRLDLEKIGIPFGDVHRGCKILVTSRFRDVLVSEVHSQNNYCVSALNKEEAWSLFSKVVGDCIEDPDLQTIAIQVANECGGLPIAILTITRALRNKPLYAWKKALEELRFPERNFKGLDALLDSTIEFCYNYLEGEEPKLTLLLCSLMKHPCDASIMDLLKYGNGLGLFEGTYTLQERRDRVYALVCRLKDSGLLLDGDTTDWFSMHDIIRNVATSIASRNHVFTVRNDVLIEWPNKDILNNCIAIFLHDINTRELPEGLEYPHLTSFCMNPNDPFIDIPDNFFAGMPKLRVLVLTRLKLLTLPSSFRRLLNLETLCLDQCILGDIAIIQNLKKLEILSLRCSNIEQLPREIGQLTHLKLLDLSNSSKLKVIPPNVISSLSQLEELYMGNTSVEWEFEGLNFERNNASLQELKNLSHLTTLEIHIQDAAILPKGLFSWKLVRYQIFIGGEWEWSGKYENTRTLKLKLPTNIYLDEIVNQLKGIEDLYLDEVPGIENVLYELDTEGFPALKHLHAQNNPFILCIVDSMAWVRCNAFPILESMFLRNLIHLEKICHGQLTAESFCKLRIIKVRNCDKLKNIFSFYISTARGLLQLQTLRVSQCKNMEEIFSFGSEDDVGYNEVDMIEFGQLRSLTLKSLPQLTNFYSQPKSSAMPQKRSKKLTTHTWFGEVILEDELDTPTPLFNEKVVFPNLETLELYTINTEKIWHNQLAAVSPCIRNLTRLIVHGCEKLKYCFTSSIIGNFVQLQHLEICYCTVLEEIVGKERGEEATATFDFPKVTFLKLWNLSELRTFYPGIHTSEWPSLKKLEVYGCDKVDIFTSEYLIFQETSEESQINIPTQQALFLVEKVSSHLEELKLSGKDIAVISHGQLPKHLFRNLKILEVLNNKSESCSIDFLQRFNNLEKLELRCSSYKEVFSYNEVEKHAGTRTQIKSLKLWKLSDLLHLWKQDSKLDSVVENLEILEVWWCDNLVNLVPSSASFGNLTTLRVWYCKGLKNLMTPFTAKSLVRLVELRIDGCKMMTEIISDEGDVAEDEIIFSKLKLLSLEHLENLTGFHSGNYTFKFPSLEHLFVIECPNMKNFSSSDLTTPMLREVQQNWGLEKGCWEGDLNATIQQLHKKKSPSQLMSTDPSFSLAEATNIDMLSSNLSGNHKTQMIQKLSTGEPDLENTMKVLKEIAAENAIVSQLEEGTSVSNEENLTSRAHSKSDDTSQTSPEQMRKEDVLSDSIKARRKYKNIADAAQAAFKAAADSAEAARELALPRSHDPDDQNSPRNRQRKAGLQYHMAYPEGMFGHPPLSSLAAVANRNSSISSGGGTGSGGLVEEFGDQELGNAFQPFGRVLSDQELGNTFQPFGDQELGNAFHKSLPERPGIDEIEAAKTLIRNVEKGDQTRLEAISRQTKSPDVPEELFMVLQEMQKSLVYFQGKEQKREALKLLDLENVHTLFDEYIQRASQCLPPSSSSSSNFKSKSMVKSMPTSTATASTSTKLLYSEKEPVVKTSELFTRDDNYVEKAKSSFYSDGVGVGTVVSSTPQILDFTLKSGGVSGQDGEKLSLIKLASLIEVSSKKGTRDVNLQNKLMDNIEWLPDSVGKLSSLISLDLSENRIVFLPATIGGLSSLKKLDLHANRIIELPDSLGDLLNLVFLDFRGNQISALPVALSRLVRLEELDFSSNNLSSLPESIGSLISLKKLIVEMNSLEELPHTIGQCSSLRELRVDYNRLKALPEAVGKIHPLKVLSVRYNNIKQLPTTMSSLSSLRELDVSFNELESVPESLCFATTLVKMNIGNNFANLHTLPRSFGNLEMLEELDISNNQIRVLPDSFRILTRLRVLRVQENPLEVPPRNIVEMGAQAVVQYMADLVVKRDTKTQPVKKKKSWKKYF